MHNSSPIQSFPAGPLFHEAHHNLFNSFYLFDLINCYLISMCRSIRNCEKFDFIDLYTKRGVFALCLI